MEPPQPQTGLLHPAMERLEGEDPPPVPTSNMCFSFWEDLTEADAAMMALSCCRGGTG